MTIEREGAGSSVSTALDAVHYIQHLASELHTMAAQRQLDFLAYLLKMAEEEAATMAKRLAEERAEKP